MKKFSKKIINQIVKYTHFAYLDHQVEEALNKKDDQNLYNKIEKLSNSKSYSINDENIHCVLYCIILLFKNRIKDIEKINVKEDNKKAKDRLEFKESIEIAKILSGSKIKEIHFILDKGRGQQETNKITSSNLKLLIISGLFNEFLEYINTDDGVLFDPNVLPFEDRINEEGGKEKVIQEYSLSTVNYKNSTHSYQKELYYFSNILFNYISNEKLFSSSINKTPNKTELDFIIELYKIIDLQVEIEDIGNRIKTIKSKKSVNRNKDSIEFVLTNINEFDKEQYTKFRKTIIQWIKRGSKRHEKINYSLRPLLKELGIK
jgi:hypothetical protein